MVRSHVPTSLAGWAEFSGRASRQELLRVWLGALCACTACYGMALLGATLNSAVLFHMGWLLLVLSGTAGFVALLAAAVRRLHDIDESGWFALLIFIPLGVFCLFPLLLLPGCPQGNRFGSGPGRQARD